MRLAYADPPYPGLAAKHYANHPDYNGEVDHQALIARLVTYDGWALSTASKALQAVLAMCPPSVRVAMWVKRSAPPFPNHGIYGWEPLILSGARPPEAGLRDWLICEPEMFTFRPKPINHVVGQKPPGFCDWLFRWLGASQSDTLDDLFPGSGSVGRAWEHWCAQLSILAAVHQEKP
jgi:hypothetical protein